MDRLTFGADPEFFLYDRELADCVPALGVTPGTKTNPEPLWDGFSLQLDGVALEINTPVYDSFSGMVDDTRAFVSSSKFLKFINQRLGATDRYTVSCRITHTFPQNIWNDVPAKNKELGCDPDYNARTNRMNKVPSAEAVGSFRTAAGHVAVGFVEKGENLLDHGELGFEAARAVAYVLGLTYRKFVAANARKEQERRSLYGTFFSFRAKPFGVEWRAPSNSWLFHNEAKLALKGTFRRASMFNLKLREEY